MRKALLAVLLTLACESSAQPGSACARDSDCASLLVCAVGRCRVACRSSRDCQPGTHCLVEPSTGLSACSVDQVDGCDAAGCPDGFACRDHQCLNLCGAIVRCPDGVCQGDVCLPTDGSDAGLAGDAGTACHGPHCDPVADLSVDDDRVLVVTASGEVWGWGVATSGALGDRIDDHGSCTACSATPVRALGPDGSPWTDALSVVAGATTCVLRRDTTVWCWGSNYAHQLGDAGTTDSEVPVQVLAQGSSGMAPLDQVIAIDTAGSRSCAIRGATREVWCWGEDTEAIVGDGGTTTSSVAVLATELGTNVRMLALEVHYTVSLDSAGTLRGVGVDACSVLGGASGVIEPHALTLPGTLVADVATSPFHVCALGMDGSLRCWGLLGYTTGHGNPSGAACAGCASGSDACTATPQTILVPQAHPFAHVFGRSGGTFFATDAEGALWAWGSGYQEPFVGSPDPVQLLASGVADARTGHAMCVRTTEGDVLCTGANDRGQLGRGTMTPSERDLANVVWP